MTGALAAACAAFLFIILMFFYLREREQRRSLDVGSKLLFYTDRPAPSAVSRRRGPRLLDGVLRFIHPLGSLLSALPQSVRLDRKMQQASIPIRGGDFVVLLALAGFSGLVLTGILGKSFLAGLAGAVLFPAGGYFWLQAYIQRRRQAFADQLGDTLVMMANALRAGFSFNQSMALIGKSMTPPVSEEFTKAVTEMQLGATAEDAVRHLAERVQSKDFDLVAMTLLIQRQVGGNLAEILNIVAHTIDDRIRIKREINVLTAQGRLSGWVLVILPFAFAGVMTWINPSYMKPLFTTPIGHILLGGGIFMDFLGLLVIKKLIYIEM